MSTTETHTSDTVALLKLMKTMSFADRKRIASHVFPEAFTVSVRRADAIRESYEAARKVGDYEVMAKLAIEL